jgi:hypothetical protein
MTRILTFAALAAVGLTGCADSILKPLGSENSEQVSNQVDNFLYEATELDNVHDIREYTWANTGTAATVLHRSFIHHGQVILMVRDGAGTLVDSLPMEYELDTETDQGVPGNWLVRLQFYGAKGRVEVGLQRK